MLRLHPYTYHRPPTVAKALETLRAHAGDAMPIAGGTDLVPNMKHRLFTPGHLVSLRGISEMRGMRETNAGLRIGALETLDVLAHHPVVLERLGSLARACGLVSGPQLRRVGTIGGNVCLDTRCTYYNQTHFWRKALGYCLKKEGTLCHVVKGGTRCVAAHSADVPPVLLTLGATLEIAGPRGLRVVPVAEFFTSDGVWNRRMEPDEILVAITVPWPKPGTRLAFQKLRTRNSIDFPLANLAAVVELDTDGRVLAIEIVASAMGAYPRRIGKILEATRGKRLSGSVIEGIAQQAYRQCHPLDNIIVDREWRRSMVPVLVRRAFAEMAH